MEYMVQAVKDQAESHKEIARVLSEIHSMTIEGNKDLKINATISKN
jgi:hypothetical protein